MLDFPSVISMGMGVLPLFLTILVYKKLRPSYHGLWMFGGILIMIAGLLAGALNILDVFIHQKLARGSAEQVFMDAQHSVTVWIYIGPAVIAAIGANLITEFILKENVQPDSDNAQ